MNPTLSSAAYLEHHNLLEQAERLARGTAHDRKRADILMAKAAGLFKGGGLSTDEHRRNYANALGKSLGIPEIADWEKTAERATSLNFFRALHSGIANDKELRDMAVGTESITYVGEGTEGGYMVPMSMEKEIVRGFNNVTPFLNPEVVTLHQTRGGAPLQIGAWDLTQSNSTRVSENTSMALTTPPTAGQYVLRGLSYKTSPVAVSIELEQDSIADIYDRMIESMVIGFARGLGADLALGANGGAGTCIGIIPSCTVAASTASPTAVSPDDLLATFHAVDRYHRLSPKCAWVMSETVWELIRTTAATASSTTNAWRWLISEDSDDELLGKPVYIDPNFSSGPSSKFVFGDLSYFHVRIGGMMVQQTKERFIDSGKYGYYGMVRADSALVQVGSDVPVVACEFHS